MATDPFNILVFLVALALAIRAVARLRTGVTGWRASALWFALWTGVGVVALFPALVDLALAMTGWQNRMNIALVAAVVVLFALVSHLAWKIEKLEREDRRNVQALALQDYVTAEAQRESDSSGRPDTSRAPGKGERDDRTGA